MDVLRNNSYSASVTRLSPSARREEIVAAALRVATTKGLANTTVRDVAAEMGTSSGLIHHYFSSMDDVLAAAFEQAAGEDLASTEAAMRGCSGAADRLAAFFASYTRTEAYTAFQIWLDAWAEASRRPALGATSRRLNVAWQRLIAATIVDGVDEGAFTLRRSRRNSVAGAVAARRAEPATGCPPRCDRARRRARLGDDGARGRGRLAGGITRPAGTRPQRGHTLIPA